MDYKNAPCDDYRGNRKHDSNQLISDEPD
ncbi:hypothetical protein CCACVL1_03096 [Corchorus capsularis]|uniref:Uncharacterized protein n=1 Tax=Corchorus capsularis TaxID=210143 RepID=A0A1R3K2W3_COCAP|nr:hypothetical protein CCACVL1_03096 [Corchorus capsularis]